MTILTTAGVVIDAAHRSVEGVVHGHTWLVWAAVPAVAKSGARQDVVALQTVLKKIAARIDHTMLPDKIAWGEDLAQWFASALIEEYYEPVSVLVERPHAMFRAEWRA